MTLLLLLFALSLFGCAQKTAERAGDDSSPDSLATVKADDSLVIVLAGMDSISVFDLLRRTHHVESQASAMGVFVTAIDSVPNTSGYYWVYSINAEMAGVSCDRCVTRATDTVRWHYRKF